jgi:hypothetical protein
MAAAARGVDADGWQRRRGGLDLILHHAGSQCGNEGGFVCITWDQGSGLGVKGILPLNFILINDDT